MNQSELKKLVYYSPITGKFWWRPHPREMFQTNKQWIVWNSRYAYKEAGFVRKDGYRVMKIDYKAYKAHRLAWLYFYGEWPDGELDHIKGDKADNRIFMLRECNHRQNGQNKLRHKNNTSGFKGVYPHMGRFRAQLGKKYLGTYTTAQEARLIYLDAAQREYGEFYNEG